jgi:hypothetical protein
MNFIVITTVNKITKGIVDFSKKSDWKLIIVGDIQGTHIESAANLKYLSIDDQINLDSPLVGNIPYNHYARKNIGYMYAIQNGANVIYDTDDDNLPYSFWKFEDFSCNKNIITNVKFLNIYKYFTTMKIWPRGFPLDEILSQHNIGIRESVPVNIGVWQGLSDIEPDVDAIYRLTVNQQIRFDDKPSVYLDKGVYCPFNSQNTFWRRELFPLLYLPISTSFRFTDILRSYIAQRLMWEIPFYVGFTKATVYQERNKHDFMNDFSQEIDCYMNIKNIVRILDTINLGKNILDNLLIIYSEMINQKILKNEELKSLMTWCDFIRTQYDSFDNKLGLFI